MKSFQNGTLLLVAGLFLAGIGTWGATAVRPLLISSLNSGLAAGPADPVSGPPSLTQDFLISLPEGEDERYLRATVVIELDTPSDRDHLREHQAQLREAFITRSADVAPSDYGGRDGMERSKSLMRAALAQTLPNLAVRGVYLSDFVVR